MELPDELRLGPTPEWPNGLWIDDGVAQPGSAFGPRPLWGWRGVCFSSREAFARLPRWMVHPLEEWVG